ncbi:polysaccharide deacetylase family protein [Hyphomicrobium facile]|uniref:Chitooligosaccharide deacetylase n=1 Tax=Hyphomicrobium facile TaxID=51670 RepID=A0A1I7NUV7_9HYPH|nr:polysaccharide deacetylase family protein [Hyphomicrobium facile]SFV38455.1 Peptidoglycan/xylan/chitin deacetylase, PgdA/CDA1 family [Hyphomicrobium facile]
MNGINAISGMVQGSRAEVTPKRTTGLCASASRYFARVVPTKPFIAKNTHPIVSFTFDDAPDSARTNGARILDRYGIRGTYYIAPGICGTEDEHWTIIDKRDVGALARAGHEIGCHTYSHVKVQSLTRSGLARETQQCFDALRDICGNAVSKNFAYPFGNVSFPLKFDLDKTFSSCRSIYGGLNSGLIDLAMLRSVELYDRTSTEQSINAILDEAIATNAWVIFYTHDVTPNPSWIGCSPAHLEMAVNAAMARGIPCLSVDEALHGIGVRG